MARLAPDAVPVRLFGLQESVVSLTVGLGAVSASLLIDLTSVSVAMVTVGALCRPWWRRRGIASGVLTAISENSTKRSGCSTAYLCCNRYRCPLSNILRVAWNLSMCLPAKRYFAKVTPPTAST